MTILGAVRARRIDRTTLLGGLGPMWRATLVGMAFVVLVAIAKPSSMVAASTPTTVDFQAVGPEAHITSFGEEHPHRFVYSPIPVSYDVSARDVGWTHWGAGSTQGRGHVQFCVIMSPCYSGPFAIRLFRRRFVSCPNGKSHFGYTRVRLDVSKEHGGPPFTDTILVGCG
jgi:hypothetical protein